MVVRRSLKHFVLQWKLCVHVTKGIRKHSGDIFGLAVMVLHLEKKVLLQEGLRFDALLSGGSSLYKPQVFFHDEIL